MSISSIVKKPFDSQIVGAPARAVKKK